MDPIDILHACNMRSSLWGLCAFMCFMDANDLVAVEYSQAADVVSKF